MVLIDSRGVDTYYLVRVLLHFIKRLGYAGNAGQTNSGEIDTAN